MRRAHRWSDAQATAILARLEAGEAGKRLAAELGVSAMTISNLKTGRTYRHLPRATPLQSFISVSNSAERRFAAARFWASVDNVETPNLCWPWLGSRLANGYGATALPLPGRTTAFRVAYHLANRIEALPAGQVIRHLCGQKSCCNPSHLLAGTKRENYEDGPASSVGRAVPFPVQAPPSGWCIERGDLASLELAARRDKFWLRVDRARGSTGCWPWQRKGGPDGHGNIRWFGKTTSTARVAWELTHGPIPAGQVVRHDCDNGSCCNPEHLCLGTTADNRQDAKRRGRIPVGEKHHYGRRTTDATVLAARERVAGGEKMTSVSQDLGVTVNTVSRWVRGLTRIDAGGPIAQLP